MTESQTLTIELPSNTVESYSKALNPEKDGTTIKYGDSKEFENVAPFSQVNNFGGKYIYRYTNFSFKNLVGIFSTW